MNFNINNFNRYIELSLGNGESLLQFNPSIPCFLNDSNTDLIGFYKYIHEPDLHSELNQFVTNWDLIGKFANFSSSEILIAFDDLNTGIISSEDVEYMIRAIVMMNMAHDEFIPLFEQKFLISLDLFTNALINPLVDALLTLKGDQTKINQSGFDTSIETAFRRGFFRHFRSLLNLQETELIDCISLSKHFACWLFIKEFSKEPQLNYDKNGNIKNHYGGSNCNNKTFIDKVAKICSNEFIGKIQSASLYNSTPSQFLNDIQAAPNDIIIANLSNSNLVLSNGKNFAGVNSLINQIKLIATLNLNLVIITDDKKLAIEFESISNGVLRSSVENNKIVLSPNLI